MQQIFSKQENHTRFFDQDIILQIDNQNVDSSQLEIVERDNGYTIVLEKTGVISIFLPVSNHSVLLGYNNRYADIYSVTKSYCGNKQQLYPIRLAQDTYQEITVPICHFVQPETNKTISFSRAGEILFSFTQYSFTPYLRIDTWSDGLLHLFVDISYNYHVNLFRYNPLPDFVLNTLDYIDMPDIRNVLYYGKPPSKPPDVKDEMLTLTRVIQEHLLSANIPSVITGSLARYLNGINCHVRDIDIMVKDPKDYLDAVIEIEKLCTKIEVQENRGKFRHGNYDIDVCFDNFQLLTGSNFIRYRHGLRYLDIEGMLWMTIILLYFLVRSERENTEYATKYRRAIFQLANQCQMPQNNSVVLEMKDVDKYRNNCLQLISLLKGYEKLFTDFRINAPFMCNGFKGNGEEIYTVINYGLSTDARLIIGNKPKQAIWKDVDGRIENLTIDYHDNFSCVIVKNVAFPGLIQCQLS